jgi:glycosyltransferase involved in cell wall biosynthesis
MKVYLNRTPKTGPWGGGIKTVNKLAEAIVSSGHELTHKLEAGIDVIFCIDPRPNERGEWYQHFVNYRNTFPKTKIIQRVGDLGTHSKPELTELVRQTLNISDFFIFPSDWAKDRIGFIGENYKVVYNRPMKVFHQHKNRDTTLGDKIRLVTHHWSMNPKKGFDIYQKLQEYINNTGAFEFTYIGRKPDNVVISKHIQPISAVELSKELTNHDIYITASIEEAGANHVLEALAAGLPVVYHKEGGSIVDYCKDYGVEFDSFNNLISSINKSIDQYKNLKQSVLSYEEDNSKVVEDYIKIIKEVSNGKT